MTILYASSGAVPKVIEIYLLCSYCRYMYCAYSAVRRRLPSRAAYLLRTSPSLPTRNLLKFHLDKQMHPSFSVLVL